MHFDDKPPRTPRNRREPADRLREALLALAGGQAAILNHDTKNWASITFAGTRHRLELVHHLL